MARGEVLAFDEAAGYGTVRSDAGIEYFFHCTTIADGTRAIAVGSHVVFDVVPGHRGRWEARNIQPELQ